MDKKVKRLPAHIIEEAKMMIRNGLVCHVIRRNGRFVCVNSLRDGPHAIRETYVCQVMETDVFSEEGRIENYINLHIEYPDGYTGRSDQDMLDRMRNDVEFDAKTGTLYIPYGRMVDGNFVYEGEKQEFRGA